ncbi:helix-turn-helix transcriptional regulator [Erwinia sp. P7711]|uniref:helix-turn-helix domain-containing protein n=1 Tax=unclassified Erwinia TaxID=2622719 RepID=UPI0029906012|nr:helix-turn-helix transcriptional regulator [Erwinia sp. MMLR14_017]MDW8845491.1 helix-turn-helix transcriptional regulator [Erwinia sp. MMLR14_017]
MEKLNTTKILFGKRVKQLRLQAGLSQEAFALKCGLDRTYVSGIERGLRNPTLEVIAVLATGLGTEMKTLIEF